MKEREKQFPAILRMIGQFRKSLNEIKKAFNLNFVLGVSHMFLSVHQSIYINLY